MMFYSIIGMHFIHVMITATMVHIAIFYTKNTNISVPSGTLHSDNKERGGYEVFMLGPKNKSTEPKVFEKREVPTELAKDFKELMEINRR